MYKYKTKSGKCWRRSCLLTYLVDTKNETAMYGVKEVPLVLLGTVLRGYPMADADAIVLRADGLTLR